MKDNLVRVRLSGEYALFTRPEHQPDRFSYDLITPSAARGALDAIYWKPEIRYRIHRIHVVRRGSRISFMRNEVTSRATRPSAKGLRPGIWIEEDRAQRTGSYLQDVEYVVDATMEVIRDDLGNQWPKHRTIFRSRIGRGACYRQPYLGTAECVCSFSPVSEDEQVETEDWSEDLGWMMMDTDYAGTGQSFPFHAVVSRGVLEVPDWRPPCPR